MRLTNLEGYTIAGAIGIGWAFMLYGALRTLRLIWKALKRAAGE